MPPFKLIKRAWRIPSYCISNVFYIYDSVGKGKYDGDCKLSVEETERIVRIFIFYSEFIPSFALPHSEEGREEIVVVTFTAT
jgi:hypothetical protein